MTDLQVLGTIIVILISIVAIAGKDEYECR